MEKLLKPQFNLISRDEELHYAEFELQPLEEGMATTIGNALRRTLLLGMPGAAIFGYRIPGVTHEYRVITGIKETLVEVTLHLKTIALRIDYNIVGEEIVTLKIAKHKVGPVYAGDFKTPTGVEVVNKDALILTITKSQKFEMEAFAKIGRGYKSFVENRSTKPYADMIAIDSNYSTVTRVSYSSRPKQIAGQRHYETLSLCVTTNGSLKPEEVVGIASNIIIDHCQVFQHLNEDFPKIAFVEKPEPEETPKVGFSVYDLELTQRSENCLIREGIVSVQDLIQYNESQINEIRNLGQKSFNEIKTKLQEIGLSLKKDED